MKNLLWQQNHKKNQKLNGLTCTLPVLCLQTSVWTLYEWRIVDFKPFKRENKLWSHFRWLSVKGVMKVQLGQMTHIYGTKFQKNRKFPRLRNEISKNVNFSTYETKSWKFVRRRATKARLTTLSQDFVSCITKHGYFVS
jgi:hypothetical protein